MKPHAFKINETCGSAKWEDELLKENEYQREDLKTKTSSEAKGSQCFNTNDYCMFASGLNKEEEQLVKIVKRVKEDGKVSFRDIVEGQSKSLGAKEKKQLLNIVVKGEDDMFLQSIEEEQIFLFF